MLNKLSEEWFRSPTLAAELAARPILAAMGGAHSESGSILAEPPHVQSVEQAERWYRARATGAYMSAMRGKLAWLVVLDTFVVAVLAVIGYPAPRVVALALTFCASLTMFVIWLSRSSVSAPKAASPQAETLQMAPRFLLMFVQVGLTGGLRSPLLPAALIPFSDLVIKTGWTRTAKNILVLIGSGLCALLLLPGSWFGPEVPQPAFWILLLAILATAGAWHTRYALLLTRTVGDSACQLGRAREEMVYRALARAREMEQIGWKLSHELKNPLAAIKGLVQLSARNVTSCDPDLAEQLRVVAAEVNRMENILKEYLSFSRPFEALQPQQVALGALADEVLSLMDARAASVGVVLRRRGDAVIEADPRRLKDALFNLVGNAVEATAQGGKVEVEIDEGDRGARIAVRDSGRGMPPEVLDRLGTPFFTTREQGTGLGVVTARAAFAQHGGSLVYSSEPGRGTTAVGTLPVRSTQHGSEDGAGAAG
jgi:signal transduction histidine kinase